MQLHSSRQTLQACAPAGRSSLARAIVFLSQRPPCQRPLSPAASTGNDRTGDQSSSTSTCLRCCVRVDALLDKQLLELRLQLRQPLLCLYPL